MKKLLIIPAFILITGICFGQKGGNDPDKVTLKPSQLLKQAKTAAKSGDIFTAIDYYKIYDEIMPDKPKVQSALGQLYLREKNYREARVYLLKSYKLDPEKNILDLFEYAVCQHILGEYDDAKQYFTLFISESKGNKDLKDYSKLAKTHIEGISTIGMMKDSSLNVIIKLLDTTVNKPHIDFSPIPYEKDKLIFASLPESEIKYYNPDEEKLPVRKFYLAQRNGDKWKNLGEFDTAINGVDINTGNGAFSGDKTRFYFARCEKDYAQKTICRLYVSNLVDNLWQTPEVLPEIVNMPMTSNSMPAVGVSRMNTDVIYFISDRPEGQGGSDLWFTFYDKKKLEWKEPKNCGKKVNTIVDEITPYYNIETKTLYFSSEGMPGMGGFDIYKTFGEAKSFEGPINIGFPINSSFDDLYYILEENRQRGFLTSNRNGGYSLRHENCCDDIYEFIYRDYINIGVTGKIFGVTDSLFFKSIEAEYKNDMALSLNVLDRSDDIELLYDYPVNLFVIDKNTGKELFVKTDFTTPGNYFFNLEQGNDYIISVRDFNKKEKRLPFTTKNITRSDTLELDAIIVNTFPEQSFVVQNIYYAFAKAELTDTAMVTLDRTIYKILSAYPEIIIEISSHTDSVDTEEFNMKLSQERAQSVVDYLIMKGINPERLIAKGYGEGFPIAPNTHPDGKDNPEGRQKNRRTEFKVVGQLENEEEIIYEDE
jgi:outer membrane protein OmpA-like peptidoglycan-associated protein